MWAIIRKPIASMPLSRAQRMCCSQMSASVTWVAMRATEAPLAAASSRSATVPMPGSSSTASRALGMAARAAASSFSCGSSERPYCSDEPPSPSPWETSTVSSPAASRPPAMRATCSAVNWCALAWLPSRRVESITRTWRSGTGLHPPGPPAGGEQAPGDLLADPDRRGGHDVEVAGVARQIVAGTLDLDEHGHLLVVVDRLATQAVAGHVAAHRLDHLAHRGGDRLAVHRAGQGVDSVAHHDRRLGRVQDDDRLGVLGAAHP